MSDIRFNTWLHQSGTGGITQVDGGHVGIGTTNPDIAVHTANAKKVNVGIVTANSIYAGNFYGNGSNLTGVGHVDKIIEGDTKLEVFDAGSQYISAEVNGSEKVRIDSTGRVLVGTTIQGTAGADDLTLSTGGSTGITIRSGSSNDGNLFFAMGTTGNETYRGFIQYEHSNNAFRFGTNATERARIDSSGRLMIGTTAASTLASSDDLTISTSGSTGITLFSATGNAGNLAFGDGTSGDDRQRGLLQYHHSDDSMRFFTNAFRRFDITSGGQVVQYTTHTSGNSFHQNTGWYGDDANQYTLEYKDFNEIKATKTVNTSNYSSIVYKREMMSEYCDIEFTLKGSSSNAQRHVAFVINGDGSDTTSNFDLLVFRTNTGSPSSNQIRLDKGGGGTGFNVTSSSVPNFFDGNERHVHIQIRKRTFSITVNRMGHSEYNYNARNSADLVSPRGYFGFSIYEPSSASPEVTIRDFKLTNYTQNAIPSTSVAFQAEIASNVSKSAGQIVKPANNEVFDNGYGGNYNTSNYRFTAPVAGMYQFSNTHNVYSSPGGQWAGLKVNGSTLYVGNKINSMPGSGDHNMTCYAIIQLQPGDYVEAIDYTNNAVTYSGSRTWNRFEGSLIAAFK